MRRPLFWVALCLVLTAALRLKTGSCDRPRAGCASVSGLEAYAPYTITGQVYQKDDESIYLKSVSLISSDSYRFNEFNSNINYSNINNSNENNLNEHNFSGSKRQNPARENPGYADSEHADSAYEYPVYGNRICENIICEIKGAEKVLLGSRVAVSGTFMSFSQAANPGEFDGAEYYRTLKIGGRLVKAELLGSGESYWRVREGLYGLKMYFRQRLFGIFPKKEAAVMSALLLGDKSELDAELKDLYKRNGILHILSISSLHITIIGMSVYKLFRRAGLPIGAAACAGSVLLLLYGGMTGFSVSACRAIGMYLLRMLAELLGRTYDMLTALGVLAAVMVTFNPFYLRHSGFLLSFTSVLGIGVVYRNLLPQKAEQPEKHRRWKKLKKIKKSFEQSLLASLSITLVTLPVQLWFYYEVPVYSVLLNLVVLPFMKPLMIMGFLVMLLPVPGIFSGPDCLILKGYELLCGAFDGLPFRAWNPGRPAAWQIAVYYGLLLGVIWFVRKRREGAAKFLTAAALSAAVLILGVRPPLENKAVFLDVGQGDCILVRTSSGENYLFDCGSSNRSGVGRYVLLPFLKYSGIHKLDTVFLTHPDSDHVNGAVELLSLAEDNAIEVGQVVLPAVEETEREAQFGDIIRAARECKTGVPVRYLAAGEGWRCGGALLMCLHPEAGWTAADENAYSLCVYVRFAEGVSLLLTGDVEGAGEEALIRELKERDIEDITVLKTAHHGSRNSTSSEFLAQANPKIAVISCGRNNRYGHPHEELMERLENCGARVYLTPESGAVTVRAGRGGHRQSGAAPFPQITIEQYRAN